MVIKSKIIEFENQVLVKLFYGDVFIITKCKDIRFLEKELTKQIWRYKNNRNGISTEGLYFKFIEYLYANSINEIKCEILLESESGYDILKKELEILSDVYGTKNCKNINNIPYVPKTIHANKGSKWLKQNEYLNYMKLLKKYDY